MPLKFQIIIYLLPIVLALISMLSVLRPYYKELKYLFFFSCILIYLLFKYFLELKKLKEKKDQEFKDKISTPDLIQCYQIPKYEIQKQYELDHLYFIQTANGQFNFLLINYIESNKELELVSKFFCNSRWFRMFPDIKYYFSSKTNSLYTEDNLLENSIGISSISYSFILSKKINEHSIGLSQIIKPYRPRYNYNISMDNFNLLKSNLVTNENELSRYLHTDLINNKKFTLGSNSYFIKTFEYHYFDLLKGAELYH